MSASTLNLRRKSARVEIDKLRHRAKFNGDRWNRSRDMAIFRFFQDGGRPPSWICYVCVRTTHGGYLVVFITEQNLVGIDAVVLITCVFVDFASLAWKCLFTPSKLGFQGFDTLNGELFQRNPKSASLRESASFEPSCAKIRRRVRPVGEFQKGINK